MNIHVIPQMDNQTWNLQKALFVVVQDDTPHLHEISIKLLQICCLQTAAEWRKQHSIWSDTCSTLQGENEF